MVPSTGLPIGDPNDSLIVINPATGWMAWKPPTFPQQIPPILQFSQQSLVGSQDKEIKKLFEPVVQPNKTFIKTEIKSSDENKRKRNYKRSFAPEQKTSKTIEVSFKVEDEVDFNATTLHIGAQTERKPSNSMEVFNPILTPQSESASSQFFAQKSTSEPSTTTSKSQSPEQLLDERARTKEADDFVASILTTEGREFYERNRDKDGDAKVLDQLMRLYAKKHKDHITDGRCRLPYCEYRCNPGSWERAHMHFRSISSHLLSHFPDPLFHCTICGKYYQYGVKHHYREHPGLPVLQYCKDRRWTREKELMDLFRKCFPDYDNAKEWGYAELMRLILKRRFRLKLETIARRYKREPVKCAISSCDFNISEYTEYHLFSHLSRHYRGPIFRCQYCGTELNCPLPHVKEHPAGPKFEMIVVSELNIILEKCFPGTKYTLAEETDDVSVPEGEESLIKQIVSEKLWAVIVDRVEAYNKSNFKCGQKGCQFGGGRNFSLSRLFLHAITRHKTAPTFKCNECGIRLKNLPYHVKMSHADSLRDLDISVMDEEEVIAVLEKTFSGPLRLIPENKWKHLLPKLFGKSGLKTLNEIKNAYSSSQFRCAVKDCNFGGAKYRFRTTIITHALSHSREPLIQCKTCNIPVTNFNQMCLT